MNQTDTEAAPKQTIISTPDADIVQRGYADTVIEANTIVIGDVRTHERAQEILKELATAVKVITKGNLADGGEFEGFDGPVAAAHKAHKFLTGLRTMALAPYEAAREAVCLRLDTYEKAEAVKAEERRKVAEEASRKLEEDRKINEAAAAEAAGDRAGADAILEEEIAPTPITVHTNTVAVGGVSKRTNYKARVDDVMELLKFVVANPSFINLITPNQSALDALAKAQKDAFKLAGCSLDKGNVRSVKAG